MDKKKIIWIVVGIVLLIIIIGSCGSNDKKAAQTGSTEVSASTDNTQTASAEKEESIETTTETVVEEVVESELTPEPEPEDTMTMGQKNALKQAESYLKIMSFSYTGLIGQLEYEGYSTEDATFAVDNCGADWNEQAAKKAKEYLNTMNFSRSGLIEQLEYEGFTSEQAEYGVSAAGY